MAITDQLMKAMGMFSEAAQEYGVSRGIEDATKAVKKLNADLSVDPMKKLESQNIVAQQLQSRLAGLGASQAQIAAAVGAVAPEIPKTPEQIRQKALAATSKEEQMFWEQKADIAEQFMGKGQLAEQVPVLDRKLEDQKELIKYQAGFDRDKAVRAAAADVKLPDDVKQFVQKTGERVGTQVSIANELNTFIDQWETLSEDEKLQQGRELMKTLNSAQGADAVGAEEVKRLGAKLEFATGNVFSSNPLQLGRDLDGFYQDVINSQAKVAKTANANRDQMRQAIIQRSIPSVAVAKEKKASSGRAVVGATPKGSPPPVPQYSPDDLKAELARRRGE